MNYDAQLDFFLKVMKKSNVQALIFSLNDDIPEIDLGLRKLLNIKENIFDTFKSFLKYENNIYYVTDKFFFTYQMFYIKNGKYMLIGPYLSFMPSLSQILDICQEYNLNSSITYEIEKYYNYFYVISDNSPFHSVIHTLYEYIWNENVNVKKIDVNREISNDIFIEPQEDKQMQMNIEELEYRYSLEKQIIQTVSMGDVKNAMSIRFSKNMFKQRLADPIRNLKNYSIIMNTILRKAAEYGGVHPVYIDKLSNEFALKIELLSSPAANEKLMNEMIIEYCNLVNNYSTAKYSKLIQHVILYINSNISSNLNLKTLAEVHDVNASYLSDRFKKETGKTLTDFVLQSRMRVAVNLLNSTNLQIQTIAQHCGILDVNYFCKLFRRFFDETPNNFRKKLKNLNYIQKQEYAGGKKTDSR